MERMNLQTAFDTDLMVEWYEKHYHCSECGTEWTDEWSCTCNDRCPGCNVETEPKSHIDLSRPLQEKDFKYAARRLFAKGELANASPDLVSPEVARIYAEASLEGR